MIINISHYFKDYKFNLHKYIIENISERGKVKISKSLPHFCISGIERIIEIKNLKYKVYKYKKISKIIYDYFSSDVSAILFKHKNNYYGLTIFTIDKFIYSNEFYLFDFLTHNERELDLDELKSSINELEEVDASFFMKFKLHNNLVLEIEESLTKDYVVNLIDKFYYSGYVFPFFDIHYYRVLSVNRVEQNFVFTFHPNVSSDGNVCYGKKKPSILNLSKLDLNYSSAYNSAIRNTSFRVNKQLIKQIIENGGGLDV